MGRARALVVLALAAGAAAAVAAPPAMNSVSAVPVRALAGVRPVMAPAPAPVPVAPADLGPAPAGFNVKLWIGDPLTGAALAGAPGIFVRPDGGDWVSHRANPDGSLWLALAPGEYEVDTVEPPVAGTALRRHRYLLSVRAGARGDTGVRVAGVTADARGYFAVTLDVAPPLSAPARARLATLAALAAEPASTFTPASACQLRDHATPARGWDVDVAAGFPRVGTRLPASGHVRALIVPVDFADVPGVDAPLAFFTPLADAVRDFYLRQSYGRLAFDFTIATHWMRMPFAASAYRLGGGVGAGDADGYRQALVRALDPVIDFSQYDAVYFLPPKTMPYDEIAYGPAITMPIATRNGILVNGASGGADMYLPQNGAGAAWQWMAHETGHTLGLVDEDLDHASATLGNWGLMANNWSRTAIEHNGWDRYLLGWLGEAQAACLPRAALAGQGATLTLAPLVRQDGALKLAMVPLGASRVLVLESRRAEGDDRIATANEGVLVYTVDTALGPLKGGYRTVRRPGSTDPLFEDAALHVGDSVSVDGVVVSVIAQGADGDTVNVGVK
jgi:M6 family metalloprotease-like protein